MSSYTRANKGNWITFRDNDGREHTGLVLLLRSDSMMVGVQDATKPYLYVYDAGLGHSKRVANNVLWAVPYEDVIQTSVAA